MKKSKFNILQYFRRLIDGGDDGASMRRFIIIVISIHFILSSFLILFGLINAKVDRELLKIILDNDFMIILVGLGVLGASNIAEIIMKRYETAAGIITASKKVITSLTSKTGNTDEGRSEVSNTTTETDIKSSKTE